MLKKKTPPKSGAPTQPESISNLLNRGDHSKAVLATSRAVEQGRATRLDPEVVIGVLKAGVTLPEKARFARHLQMIARSLSPDHLDGRDRRKLARLAYQSGHHGVAHAINGAYT